MKSAAKILIAGLGGATMLTFIASWEGTEPKPYRDIAGVLTVCNGYTGKDIDPNKVYGKAECDALLKQELTAHGKAVLACVKVPLNQNQYNAFVSLAYNVGAGAVCKSGLPKSKSLIDLLNEGDYTAACNRIMAYNKIKDGPRYKGVINGKEVWIQHYKEVRGLTNRRKAERDMCLTPVSPPEGGSPEVSNA